VTRGSKGLLASVALTVSAGVALAGTLRQRRGGCGVVLEGCGAAVDVGRSLGGRSISSIFVSNWVQGPAGVGEVDRGSQRRDGVVAHLRVVGAGPKQFGGVGGRAVAPGSREGVGGGLEAHGALVKLLPGGKALCGFVIE
jgi:hypothetical protein